MLSKTEKINLSTVEIAKRIRKQLKSEFNNCIFSVTTENFAGGSTININLMKADTKMVQDFQDIPEDAPDLLGIGYTKEDIKLRQLQKYHQLNKFTLRGEYNPSTWCNGVFLTEQGHDLLRRVARIAEEFNFDDSDPQSDYSSVNFYLDLELGKWNKDFKDGGER